MQYTQIAEEQKKEVAEICQPTSKIFHNRLESEISYFAFHQLGVKPYTIQHILFKEIESGPKRIILCKSRQVGMSFGIAVVCLWAALFNKFKSGPYKNTKICIVSQDDEAAKKLITEIRSLIYKGDEWNAMLTNGKITHALSCQVDENERNNMSQITFTNKCWIKSFPPTKAIRGNSADICIVDEAAFVDEEVYTEAIEPTTSKTDGKIILSSTPKGQNGLFFNTFDPEDKQREHEFKRFWFNWTQCEDFIQLEKTRTKKRFCELSGDMKSFDQEYNALFTVDKTAFLKSEKVNEGIDQNATELYEYHDNDCILAIDYGQTLCHSVITITTMVDNVIRVIYQYSFPLESDEALIIPLVKELKLRFRIVKFVGDDCSQGYRTNRELEGMGELERFNFRSDSAVAERNRGYFMFRAALYQGRIKFPNIPELITELKGLQEETLKITTNIAKPNGGFDDRADSTMMACFPFLKDGEESFESAAIGRDNILRKPTRVTEDTQWTGLISGFNEEEVRQQVQKVNEENIRTWREIK